jgi:hypothetical protein
MADWRAVWGVERGAGRYYVDLALFTIAWIGTTWLVCSAAFTEFTDFDKKWLMATALVVSACCLLAYNRMLLIGGVAFLVAARGVLVLFFIPLLKLKIAAAIVVAIAFWFFARLRKQPAKAYPHEQTE